MSDDLEARVALLEQQLRDLTRIVREWARATAEAAPPYVEFKEMGRAEIERRLQRP